MRDSVGHETIESDTTDRAEYDNRNSVYATHSFQYTSNSNGNPRQTQTDDDRAELRRSEQIHEDAPLVATGQMEQRKNPAQHGSRWWRRLGWFLMIWLLLSVLAIVVALGFLWFLWSSNGSNEIWRQIMVAGWLTRIITILSMIIRLSASFQGTAAASMLAAVALERGQLSISKSAAASLIRSINGGPLDLLWLFRGGIFLKRKRSTAVLVFGLVLTTGLSQLTSTALLSDLKPGLVPGNFAYSQIPFRLIENYDGTHDLSRTVSGQGLGLGLNKPPFYPMFAEYAEDTSLEEGVVDTGMTLRAFFPLASEQARSLLRNYSGPATLFDSRVTCMRPLINITEYGLLGYGNYSGKFLGILVGTMQVDKVSPRVFNFEVPTTFVCPMIYVPEEATDQWALSLCGLDTPGVMVDPFQDPSTLNVSTEYVAATLSHFIINTTGTYRDWIYAFGSTTDYSTTNYSWRYEEQQEWLNVLPSTTNDEAVKFSFTACYANVNSVDLYVEASSSVNRTEPSVVWDTSQNSLDSLAVRNQLGAIIPKENHETRGIMSLQPKTSWIVDQNGSGIVPNYTATDHWYGWTSYPNASLIYCTTCLDTSESEALTWLGNSYISSVFQKIMQDTLNPALAFQAYITTIFQQVYYTDVSEFGVVAPSNMQSFVPVTIPTMFNGLAVVTGVLTMHMSLVLGAIVLFQYRTRYSMLKNSWQSVTQTFSSDTQQLFMAPSMLTDREIEKLLELEGRNTHGMLRKLSHSERVGVQMV